MNLSMDKVFAERDTTAQHSTQYATTAKRRKARKALLKKERADLLEETGNHAEHIELLADVAFAAGERPGFHVLMAGFALKVESILERRLVILGFLLVAGIAGLSLPAPVIQECIKIMMAPSAIQLVFRMKLVIELDQRSLVLSNIAMIKHKGIILGMSRRDKNRKNKDNQEKFYVCHWNFLLCSSVSKTLSRRVNPALPHRRYQQV